MRILLSAAMVVAVISFFSPTTAEAQFNNGFRFGTGISSGFGGGGAFGGGCCTTPREQPPFFAKFPPVYYNGIVPRPYGYSPFAVPGGIAPAELQSFQPLTVSNPFFDGEFAPVSDTTEANNDKVVDEVGNKVTWKLNPYVEVLAIK